MEPLLEHKNAIIYGAGGGIGGGVARTFAREGAKVFLAGRTRASLDAVAEDIVAAGGWADVAEVDALDEEAVNAHAEAVASQAGSIDVSFNLINRGDVRGIPLVDRGHGWDDDAAAGARAGPGRRHRGLPGLGPRRRHDRHDQQRNLRPGRGMMQFGLPQPRSHP
jgi:NAD(P)-dependent dehydrogenase (short-subunit alcohol dehydrogenase family)